MGTVREHPPVMPIVAAFSRLPEGLRWACQQAEAFWGSTILTSPPFSFVETNYYQDTMGDQLQKMFWLFAPRDDLDQLPAWKRMTNDWEVLYATTVTTDLPRPINIDPGYLTESKLVLASTKDFAHRIYLSQGVFAEITLHFRHGGWQPHEWTFPDYRRSDYHAFFDLCRQEYRRRKLQWTRNDAD